MTRTEASGRHGVRGVEAAGLTKRYGSHNAVDDLSFTVAPGSITGFLGPNGAGKSTTLRMLMGLTRPSAGTITIGGAKITELREPARSIGALLDARAVHPRRSARDHLLAFAYAARLDHRRVDEVLDIVGLRSASRRPAGSFSLGMNQRLGIAMALLGDPPVLVFDEPLNGLDPEAIRWMRSLMRQLAEEGRTILFSSHLMSEMELTADALIVIGRGRLIAQCTVDEFIKIHTEPAVRVQTKSLTELAQALNSGGFSADRTGQDSLLVSGVDSSTVGAIAAQHGIALDELIGVRESLEDVFLRLTHNAVEYESQAA